MNKSALASRVWTENCEIQKGGKLLKEHMFLEELIVWGKKISSEKTHKILSFDVHNDNGLIKNFVKPPLEHDNQRPTSSTAVVSSS